MYITKNHIAFYSNVFGYVTKLLIPVKSVARISKEKTVKIIPNAIAVATIDERHVFSSFLSREAAYQLMISVWKEALPMYRIDSTTSAAQIRLCSNGEKNAVNSCDVVTFSRDGEKVSVLGKASISSSSTLQVHQRERNSNSGVSEIDDESSSAISGNESMLQLMKSQAAMCLALTDQTSPNNGSTSSNSNTNPSNCDLSANPDTISDMDVSKCHMNNGHSMASTPKTAFDKTKTTTKLSSTFNLFKLEIPRTIHIAYFGLSLAIILTLVAVFLFCRIAEIKSTRLRPFLIDDFNKV